MKLNAMLPLNLYPLNGNYTSRKRSKYTNKQWQCRSNQFAVTSFSQKMTKLYRGGGIAWFRKLDSSRT